VHQRWILSLITLFFLLGGVASEDGVLFNQSPTHSSWANETTALPIPEGKTPDARIMCQAVYLIRKGNNYVMGDERQFTLLPGSVLHDAQKKPITLQDLTLPCHASLCYYIMPNRRDACLVSLCLMPER
jgi:hypothetical protein